MEHFIVNLSTKNVRREKLLGRNYLVAPATILSPGVLNGSMGPLFYPSDEISANPMVWNGTPITVGHPQRNGVDVSAKEPDILEKYGVGWVFNDIVDNGQRKVETWFDEELLKRKAPSTYYKILAGKPEELSTGLKTDNYPVKPGTVFNGRPYTHIARNYRPDHLAILPDAKGACSIADGCGVLVNGEYAPILEQLDTNWMVDGDTFDRVTHEGQELWQLTTNRMRYDEEDDRDTTDNRKGKGSMPSKGLDMSPAKACQILKDGSVHGHPLTSHQRGMFGALCGQMKKSTKNTSQCGCDGKEGSCEQCKTYAEAGITVNQATQTYPSVIGLFKKLNPIEEVTNMDRNAMISWLTTNCACWKDKGETLNKLTDEEIKNLKDGYEKFVQDKTLLQNQLTTATNKLKEVEQKSTPAPAATPAPVVTNTANEWWKPMGFSSQEHAVAVLNAAKNVEAEKRAQLAAQLTVNIKDPAARQAKAEKLLTKSVEELTDMLELMPTTNSSSSNGSGDPAQRLLPHFFGAGSPATTNRAGPELPVLDLTKEREKYDPWVLNKVVKAS